MMIRKLRHGLRMALFRRLLWLAPGQNYAVFAGSGSRRELCRHMALSGLKRVLVVTDRPLVELGITAQAIDGLAAHGVETVIFDDVLPDPTFAIVERGRACYEKHGCDSLLAVGGGSSIDSAKGIGIAVTHPGPVSAHAGMGALEHPLPPMYAIPTTAGTGSEATQGAVLSDDTTHEKYIIGSKELLPLASALDPELMTGMPPAITAATGLDALTHAVEAYISLLERNNSRQLAETAIRLVFAHLPTAVRDGSNSDARAAMAWAAYTAGKAINQVNVGNVHAVAHQLGAFYGIPHGVANAMVMPHVLEKSLPEARPRITEMARMIGCDSAEAFIAAIRQLMTQTGLPLTDARIRSSDFAAIIGRAILEGDGYPVPHLLSESELREILGAISG